MSFGVDLFLRKSLSRLPRLFRIAAALLEVLPPSSLVKGGGDDRRARGSCVHCLANGSGYRSSIVCTARGPHLIHSLLSVTVLY